MSTMQRLTGEAAAAFTLASTMASVSLGLGNKARRPAVADAAKERLARLDRLRAMAVEEAAIAGFVARFGRMRREQMVAEGLLAAGAPARGGRALDAASLTVDGRAVLQEAKDLLFGLLFGDEACGVRLKRRQRELLTLVVPRAKAGVLRFLQASTELACAGTWRDPENVAHDARAENVILEVEYGEVASERVGDGILAALRVINLLEVNEQVLYARMTNIEQSSLVD